MSVVSDSDNGTVKSRSKKEALVASFSSCPPTTPLSTVAAQVLLVALIYGTMWGLTQETALPGGSIFGIFFLGITCYLGGQLMKIIKLPTLVGMIVVGFILRNVPHINIADDIPEKWGATIRSMALILILLRAGLEVDIDVLNKSKATCSKLIFVPFIVEFCIGAVAAHFLLDMPWKYSFLMGTMLSAVSPAVVLPVMLKLQKKGIGTSNGVPTMVIAVAGIDDVLALTGFEIVLGITFSHDKMAWTIARGPLEVLGGIVYGILLGVVTWYIPNPQQKSVNVFRFLLMVFGGMFVLFGSDAMEWGAAGALGCICLPFVGAIGWKKGEDWDEEDNPVGEALAFIWRIIEPFLFGLVGSEIRLEYLQPSIVGLGLATMFIALALRMLASLLAAFQAGLSLKEQIFVTFAGIPKATVQAAIGPTVLGMAKACCGTAEIEYGKQILTVAVLAILITAPIGATTIALLAPRLLDDGGQKPKPPEIADTVIPLYDTQNTYNAYITKDADKLPGSSGDNNSNIYSSAKL